MKYDVNIEKIKSQTWILHNGSLLISAENTINQFINNDKFTVWLTDSEGNHFIPKGNITVNFINIKLEEKKDE